MTIHECNINALVTGTDQDKGQEQDLGHRPGEGICNVTVPAIEINPNIKAAIVHIINTDKAALQDLNAVSQPTEGGINLKFSFREEINPNDQKAIYLAVKTISKHYGVPANDLLTSSNTLVAVLDASSTRTGAAVPSDLKDSLQSALPAAPQGGVSEAPPSSEDQSILSEITGNLGKFGLPTLPHDQYGAEPGFTRNPETEQSSANSDSSNQNTEGALASDHHKPGFMDRPLWGFRHLGNGLQSLAQGFRNIAKPDTKVAKWFKNKITPETNGFIRHPASAIAFSAKVLSWTAAGITQALGEGVNVITTPSTLKKIGTIVGIGGAVVAAGVFVFGAIPAAVTLSGFSAIGAAGTAAVMATGTFLMKVIASKAAITSLSIVTGVFGFHGSSQRGGGFVQNLSEGLGSALTVAVSIFTVIRGLKYFKNTHTLPESELNKLSSAKQSVKESTEKVTKLKEDLVEKTTALEDKQALLESSFGRSLNKAEKNKLKNEIAGLKKEEKTLKKSLKKEEKNLNKLTKKKDDVTNNLTPTSQKYEMAKDEHTKMILEIRASFDDINEKRRDIAKAIDKVKDTTRLNNQLTELLEKHAKLETRLEAKTKELLVFRNAHPSAFADDAQSSLDLHDLAHSHYRVFVSLEDSLKYATTQTENLIDARKHVININNHLTDLRTLLDESNKVAQESGLVRNPRNAKRYGKLISQQETYLKEAVNNLKLYDKDVTAELEKLNDLAPPKNNSMAASQGASNLHPGLNTSTSEVNEFIIRVDASSEINNRMIQTSELIKKLEGDLNNLRKQALESDEITDLETKISGLTENLDKQSKLYKSEVEDAKILVDNISSNNPEIINPLRDLASLRAQSNKLEPETDEIIKSLNRQGQGNNQSRGGRNQQNGGGRNGQRNGQGRGGRNQQNQNNNQQGGQGQQGSGDGRNEGRQEPPKTADNADDAFPG